MTRKAIGIVGFGRFGQVLHRLFKAGFEIKVSSSTYKPGDIAGVDFASLKETIRASDAIFLTVPINKMGETATRMKPFLTPGQVVVDVCSIKEYSYGVLKKALEENEVHIWPTHPMFGPDSAKNGFQGLRWVSCEEDIDVGRVQPYLDYIDQKGLAIVRVSCQEHDRLAARTQGLAHLIGRVMEEVGIERTQIDTAGFEKLIELKEQTCNDSWELFSDLQYYNEYSQENEEKLQKAINKVFSSLNAFRDTQGKR